MYQLEYKRWIRRQLARLPDRIRKDIAEILIDLPTNPYPPDSKWLRDEYDGFRKIRVDGY